MGERIEKGRTMEDHLWIADENPELEEIVRRMKPWPKNKNESSLTKDEIVEVLNDCIEFTYMCLTHKLKVVFSNPEWIDQFEAATKSPVVKELLVTLIYEAEYRTRKKLRGENNG